jgi:NAD(P)-dependent dehydrogenase (short-subunit alcohol dehydrogenase family)
MSAMLSAHPLDLRSAHSIRQSMQSAIKRWGRLDILLHVAAVGTATVQAYAQDAAEQDSAMFAIKAAFTESLPKHRLIEPSEMASIMLFLASSYSTPLHGAVLDASMGLGVRPGMITERGH